MAFTLRIKKTGLFGNKTISLQEIVQNCGFKYGVYNDFYVLDEDQDKFIKYVMEHGATKYDANHILLPEYTKEQILEIAEACEID